MAHPLTKEDLQAINDAQKAIRSTKDVIVRAKIAMIDVSDQEAKLKDASERLSAIKEGFFPSGRP